MPLDNVSIPGYPAPAIETDWVTVGANLESEAILNKGWTPLRVKTNGDVAFVRTVTSRLFQSDGVTAVTAYYDVQDFQVLYYWRRVLKTRVSQPDFTNVKASAERARALRGEMVRLAMIMQEQNMFQSVTEFVKEFVVERSATDRHRFDFKTPVNVIPGLHVIAGNIAASTRFDTITV